MKKLSRPFTLRRLLIASATCLLPIGIAQAQSAAVAAYPTKTVRWVIPTSPGAGTDITARAFAQVASETWKQSVVPDNRPGASGMLGLDSLAQAAPDGYTLGFFSVSQFIDATLAGKYAFEAGKDFTPISLLASTPLLLVAHVDSNIPTMAQLLVRAKAQPGKLNYASGGAGGVTHLAMEVLLKKAGIEVAHIPYKGSGPAIIDLLGGRVDMAYSTPPAVMAHIRSGKLKALAVSAEARISQLPDIPTLNELKYPGTTITTWYGLFGPANMPPELVDKIARSLTSAARVPATSAKISMGGVDPVLNTPAEFARNLATERASVLAIAKMIGFKKDN